MKRRFPLVVALVAAPLCVGGLTAGAVASSSHAATPAPGTWQAKLTYAKVQGSATGYTGLRLSVVHLGKLVFNMPVKSALFPSGTSAGGGLKPSSVSFHDLDGDGTPELVLVLWTGGAHCCYLDQIFDFARQPAHKTEADFRDSGARVTTVNGRVILQSADDRFDYAFTDYADSASPVQVWQYRGSRLVNTTRSYTALVVKDAAQWWTRYLSTRTSKKDDDVRGILAAWAADESLLGDGASAKTQLLQIAADGDLNHGVGSPKGTAYVASLWKFLGAHGYLR